ncbi:hypothetical protein PUNSTDRAFT_146710 [Punctularia strigosozonata HHB-11173 SS5]|uniref:SAM domain-containing protein n=1 Tax=Punctularia strigosozonata (strain HHB-11173) TaxID=741275 RepID=R7S237_PUNST|nr:uncharacterized protein PUNSTDRAFT_146710 [Punctularia strigosozonata HHB-11173 SS5]EIN03929.1 hypothetical protein PUNSTDRAFT_146710 [Punctularia strigosozonata HHB-11173 SS5]
MAATATANGVNPISSPVPATPPPSSRPLPSPSFPLVSPKKHEPNPHPYAIKTTSTALLSRANSSGHTNQSRHYYVPLSPSPTNSSLSTGSRGRKSSDDFGKGHKHSKSLNDEKPRPLPTPPRALPTPPPRSSSSLSNHSNSSDVGFVDAQVDDNWTPPRRTRRAETLPTLPNTTPAADIPYLDLPANPKLWTPSQLGSYLSAALRVRSGGQDALPQAVARDIAAFVRQARIGGRVFLRLNEGDLEEMGVNQLWRSALLAAARALRADAVKGRIWGPDADASSPLFPLFSPSASSENLLSSNGSKDILSSPERMSEAGLDDEERAERRRVRREGRVSRIVQSLESRRSESGSELGSESGSDVGSVHGDHEISYSPPDVFAPISRARQDDGEDQEPTMEELLANSATGSWGARAWEEMDAAPGATMKHVDVPEPELDLAGMETIVPSHSGGSGKSKGSGGLKGGKARDERRVVTAIFSPEEHGQGGNDATVSTGAEDDRRLPTGAEDDGPVQRLQAELDATHGLVDDLRRRLELLEARITAAEDGESVRVKELEAKLEEERLAKEEALTRAIELAETLDSERREREKSIAEQEEKSSAHDLEEQNKKDAVVSSRDVHLRRGRELAGKLRDELQLPSMSQLPSYVLLVGFGVCVVALRVVFRKMVMAGRGTR